MKTRGGARVLFQLIFFSFVLGWASPTEARISGICHRAVSWLRVHTSSKKFDLDTPVQPIRGVIDAVAVSIEIDGKFLMGHRIAPPMAGRWGGLGGKLEKGESIRDAAIRELREEAGIEIEDLTYEFMTVSYLEENGNRYRVFVISAQSIVGEPKLLEPHKTSELRWFSPAEIPFFLTSATEEFFLRKGILRSGKNARPQR